MVKLDNKFEKFKNATKRLNEANTAYKSEKTNDLYQDALIQRFEFTFELAWKTLHQFLILQGVTNLFNTPKAILKEAFNAGYISDEETWGSILEDRNLMSHTYDESVAARIAEDISTKYCKLLSSLYKTIQDNL